MNRSEILRLATRQAGATQSGLSRVTGVPQSRISRYLSGHLEPSEETLGTLLSALGLTVSVTVAPVPMERTKLRSWMLHRRIGEKLARGLDEEDWQRMARNLVRVRANTQGEPHESNIDRWQQIIDARDVRTLRRVLIDTSTQGIEMREVSPMTGFLTEEERLDVLSRVRATLAGAA